jgi:hypothetical protein
MAHFFQGIDIGEHAFLPGQVLLCFAMRFVGWDVGFCMCPGAGMVVEPTSAWIASDQRLSAQICGKRFFLCVPSCPLWLNPYARIFFALSRALSCSST